MEFTFAEALQALQLPGAAPVGFRLMNPARAPQEYLLATLLPEVLKPSYSVQDAYMLVRTTMAGQVGMSSPYPPGGVVELSTFMERTTKIANQVTLEEQALREIQEMLRMQGLQGNARKEFLVNEALNFYNKIIVQAHWDTSEWLHMQALFDGKLDWLFNGKHLEVDYKVPAAHMPAARVGNDGYLGSASKFWEDHYNTLRLLRYNVRTIILSTDLWLQMANNDANRFEIVAQTDNTFRVRRYRNRGNIEVLGNDVRDTVQFVTYDLEGEVLDPEDTSKTIKIPFAPRNKLLYVAKNSRSGYRVGEGSTPNPENDLALGFSHIAPTVEGGRMGRWGDMYIPQEAQWSIAGRGVTNLLPVRQDVTATQAKTVVLTTEV